MNFLTLEQFTEMWNLQDQLNSRTSGPDWTEKKQNWNLAIKSEIMEFFDYIGWKWWKEPDKVKKPSDMQARLEAVDIWHFLLSSIIETSNSIISIEKEYSRFASYVFQGELTGEGYIESIMMLDSIHSNNCTKVTALTDMLQLCSWTWEELYKAYIGKVALNNFRQANGYKEGTYQKIWWGMEDNVHLEKIIKTLAAVNSLDYETIFTNLSLTYADYLDELSQLQ